ncbi:MAG TPA: tryptophan--tRNA ligase [Thermodesulfovibrionia bacterium]|nr:tryptophan--tRNA ligase [Thermodesulfovibrionia bacterium]
MDIVLSGMQPSGKLHLGNLVGALQNWVRLQNEYDCYYFVADWHALTSQYSDTSGIKENVRDMLVNWLAAGLSPEKATLFIQSRVKAHAELHVLLSMIVPLPWLERVPSFKEKQEEVKDRDLNTYGFLGYPLLQSADILLYKTRYVPVGQDQLPHLEITREIVRRFNNIYQKEVFIEPKALLTPFPKVVGLDGRKMSKTYNNCIYLSDTPDEVTKKIKTMVTDPARVRRTDPGTPELSPVFHLHKIFSSQEELKEIDKGCTTAHIGCIDCKKVLIRNIFKVLEPIWEKREHYLKSPGLIDDVIEHGTRKAVQKAQETIEEVVRVMGL